MPQSLLLSTPLSTTKKRQRSRESRNEPSRPTSAGQEGPDPLTEEERLARSGVGIPSYLNKSKSEVQTSFQELEWKQRYRMANAMSNSNSPFKIDRSATVTSRNRYGNVQPWENARVKLSTPIHGSDYINASPIKLRSLRPTSAQRGRSSTSGADTSTPSTPFEVTRYVATQGPKSDQFSHFWLMVMQQSTGEAGVIVMLTQCYEGLKEKCAQYFPLDKDNPVISIAPEPKSKRAPPAPPDNGDAFLESDSESADTDSSPGTESTNDSGSQGAPDSGDQTEAGSVELLSLIRDSSIGCEVRELKVSFGEQTKTIYHYFYDSWADFGKPEAEDRVALLQLMRVSKQVAADSPRIVHCSAGVGRTGTWIALDFLLRELEEGRMVDSPYVDVSISSKTEEEKRSKSSSRSQSRKPSDKKSETWGKSGPPKTTTPEPKDNDVIYETVDRLRTQRMMMVMNEIQYAFLYEALREAFVDKYAVKETGPMVMAATSEEPSPKVARTNSMGGTSEGTRVEKVKEDEGTVSEAETEIQDHGEVQMGGEDDPYAAAAPESIRKGLGKEKQQQVRGHEVQ